jgi:hypothetical protein
VADDIVTRLNVEIEAESWGLLVDARNEIERLRAECDDLQVLLRGRTAEFQAEIERLRAVIAAIEALPSSADRPETSADYWVIGYTTAMDNVKKLLPHNEARRG